MGLGRSKLTMSGNKSNILQFAPNKSTALQIIRNQINTSDSLNKMFKKQTTINCKKNIIILRRWSVTLHLIPCTFHKRPPKFKHLADTQIFPVALT